MVKVTLIHWCETRHVLDCSADSSFGIFAGLLNEEEESAVFVFPHHNSTGVNEFVSAPHARSIGDESSVFGACGRVCTLRMFHTFDERGQT